MHKLIYYQKKFEQCYKQGTDQWLEARRFSFGGSEISILLNQNRYDNWENLLDRKKNKSFLKTDCTTWGNLFEPVSKHYITKKHGVIFEFGAIPHPMYPISYSPDGILINESGDNLILLEIKCPIYRGVHKIPPHYLCQIQCGLNIFNAEYGLFSQFRFRRCKLNDKPWNCVYDRKYHKEYRKRCKDKHPISYGYLYWEFDCDLVDLGTKDCITEELIKIPKDIRMQIIIEKLLEPKKGVVLMWKLFDIEYNKITPNRNYLQDHENLLWNKYKLLTDEILTEEEDFELIKKE